MYLLQTNWKRSFTNSVNRAEQKLNYEWKVKVAVNNALESYEMLEQIVTL